MFDKIGNDFYETAWKAMCANGELFWTAAVLVLASAQPFVQAMFPSRVARATKWIEESHFGRHQVVQVNFRGDR